MKLWLRASEIAELACRGEAPGMPTTKAGVLLMAERDGWFRSHALVRAAEGVEGGGGYEFHIEQWPLAARLVYIARQFDFDPKSVARDIGNDGLTQRARDLRDAKVFVVKMADAFKKQVGLASHASDRTFCDLYNAGSIDVPDWVKQAVKSLCRRSLVNYRKAMAEDSNRLGKDPALSRRGTGLLDTANGGEVRTFILGLVMLGTKHFTARDILIQCRARFGDEIVDRAGELKPMPPEWTFQHFIKALKVENEVAITKVSNPDKYRSHYALSGTNAFSWVKEPNQLWQIDASPVDVLCVDGRHSIYICIDLATRRIVITTSRTPRAAAVGLMVRKAILKFGVASTIKTDNGSDFVARDTCRLFDHLGIDVQRSQKYSPQEKGHVERAIGTFQRDFGPKMPGFIGHNVSDRAAIESRRSFAERLGCDDADAFAVHLTAAELQVYIDRWIEVGYNHRGHEGLDGKTPNDAAEASVTTVRRVDERALDVLLLPVKAPTMTKRGFKVNKHYYRCAEVLPRTRCLLRMDPLDAGRAHVFSEDGDVYLGVAICYELAGIDPVAATKADRAKREGVLRGAIEPARNAVRHLTGTAIIDNHLSVLERDAAVREAQRSNVIRFPPREESHVTPQISAAVESTLPMPVAPLNERAAEIHRQIMADINAPALRAAKVMPINPVEEAYGRFRRALQLEKLQRAGTQLDENDTRWLAGYREGPEYTALSSMRENFGEAMGF